MPSSSMLHVMLSSFFYFGNIAIFLNEFVDQQRNVFFSVF